MSTDLLYGESEATSPASGCCRRPPADSAMGRRGASNPASWAAAVGGGPRITPALWAAPQDKGSPEDVGAEPRSPTWLLPMRSSVSFLLEKCWLVAEWSTWSRKAHALTLQ